MKQTLQAKIVDAFIERVGEDGLAKVQVSHLLQSLGLSRNTFYYYYFDKFDLAKTVFLEDLSRELERSLPESDLVYAQKDCPGKKTLRVAFYAREEVGAHAYDSSGFMEALLRTVERRRAFYRRLFQPTEVQWRHDFEAMYRPEVQNDVRLVLGARYMDEETLDYLAELGVQHILATVSFSLQRPPGTLPQQGGSPFLNFYWEALSNAIKEHPLVRRRSV